MKKLFYILTICSAISFSQNVFAERVTVDEYVEKFRDFSISEMYRTGIPASIKLAQGILESDAGNSVLAKNSNNHFGIKCKVEWTGKTYYHEDDDYDNKGRLLESCFRAYISPYESYLDHSEFLSNRDRYGFLFAFHHTDYKQWAIGLKAAGYATAVSYAETIIGIVERYNLSQYDFMPNPYEVKPLSLAHTFGENEELAILGGKKEPEVVPTKVIIEEFGIVTKGYIATPTEETKPQSVVFFPEEGKEYFQINNIVAVSSTNQTLAQIATKNEIKLKKLLKYNELGDTTNLIKNQYVFLSKKQKYFAEQADTHTVQEGENMYIIAQRYGIRTKHLYKINKLKKGTEPTVGQTIALKG
jgi:LysM repeat protein